MSVLVPYHLTTFPRSSRSGTARSRNQRYAPSARLRRASLSKGSPPAKAARHSSLRRVAAQGKAGPGGRRRPPALGAPPFQKAPRPQRLPAIPLLRGLRDEIHSSSPSLILLPERNRCTLGNADSRNQRSRRAICSTPEQEACRLRAGGGLRLLFDLRYRCSCHTT